MTLKDFYSGKKVLLTGTTGFLGKVLLQKFLFSFPQIDRIYVLIRGKKGSDLLERFKKEIVSSPCFDRIRKIYQNKFAQFIERKVFPIQGDLHRDGLGFSKKDHEEITNNCQIIINCAASIDFNARIDQAIQSNIKGSLRMMKLAKQTKKLQIFTHISTCYVNCNLRGLIREDIYDSNQDPEEQLRNLLKLPLKELVARTPEILGAYPNTYTFTKALCERIMKKNRQNLTLCIVRPAIINTSYAQPFPGWLDSIAAAAAFYLFSGLGILKEIEAQKDHIGDTVPVDCVVGNIIVATAFNAFSKQLSIYHVGSSDRNPLTWDQVASIVNDFWSNNQSQNQVSKPTFFISKNPVTIKISEMKRNVPSYLYTKIAPYLGGQHVKNSQRLLKTQERAIEIKKIFKFFVSYEWIYECRKVRQLTASLTTEERKNFLIDCADIDMKYFIILNNYGLQKFVLKENIEMPTPQNANLLRIRPRTYFSDIKWALTEGGVSMKGRNGTQFRSKILSSKRVLAAIQKEAVKRQQNSSRTFEEEKKLVMKDATVIATQLVGEFKMPVVRFLAWTLHKIFKRIYEKVNVNQQMFETLKQIQQKKKIPIVLLPTHRSYIDFLIVGYIFFLYKLKLPYIVSDEALMNAYLIPFLIRSSGAFFFRKNRFQGSQLYKAIFNEYIQRLLTKGNNLEFFIEGSRSRTGKTLHPRLEIFQILIETVQNNLVPDICLVPLTINYEKVLEGDTFPSQLLGQQKVQQSLLRVLKAFPLLKVNFGRVYVEICEPIFLKNFLGENKNLLSKSPSSKNDEIIRTLAFKIVHQLTEKVVIMSTGLVSAVLLMHRKGISEDLLIKTVHWLTKYISRKGCKIGGINENSATFAVRNAINYLDNITVKTKKSIFELQISAGNEFQKILMLSYYRNTIIHAFLPEAFLGCALTAFGEESYRKEGVKLRRLEEQTLFLMQILSIEYILPWSLSEFKEFPSLINELLRNSIINKLPQERISTNHVQQKFLVFYCSLLRPAIECYWSVIIYILTIAKSETKRQQISSKGKLYDQVQWFMQSLFQEKVISNYESCSLETIKNAFEKYMKMKIVTFHVSKKQVIVEVNSSIQQLEELQNRLKNFLKNGYHSSVTSPQDIARSAVIGTDMGKL